MIENLSEALKGIFSHKMRSFLTMLGVIIGIASILAIVSIVEGTSKKLQKSLIGAGNNVTNVTLQQSGSDDYNNGQVITSMTPISKAEINSIKKIPGVEDAARYVSAQFYDGIRYNDMSYNNGPAVTLYGITPTYFKTTESRLIYGRNFTQNEYSSTDKVCIIGEQMCESLFNNSDPTGLVLEIKGEPFYIVGVVGGSQSSQTSYESIDDYNMSLFSSDSSIYIPMKSFAIPVSFDAAESAAIRVSDTRLMKTVGNQAADILNMNSLPSGCEYKSASSSQVDNSLKTLTNAITAMLVSIASLSLLVGGIGVMNIMLVSVTERTSEIGLKKALGAKRRDILVQFLTESAVLTGVGGLIGLLLGIIIARIISIFLQINFAVPIQWVFISMAFSLAIGIFFGVAPANKASKLNPIDALRRE